MWLRSVENAHSSGTSASGVIVHFDDIIIIDVTGIVSVCEAAWGEEEETGEEWSGGGGGTTAGGAALRL